MNNKASYDVIVIGSGSAGFSAVESASSLGASVCLIEKDRLGGECPNAACVPSKSLLKAAKVYRSLATAKQFGITIQSSSFQFADVVKYRQRVVDALTGGGAHGNRYEKILQELGVDVRFGAAEFVDEHVVRVNGENIFGKSIVIATGTTDFIPPIPGLAQIHFLRSKEALSQTRQPKSLAIIGGGPVGCEIATYYASFGTRVVILQSAERLLNHDDRDVSLAVKEMMEKLGVQVILNATIAEIVDGRGGVYGVRTQNGTDSTMHAVEQVLVAAGKRSNVQGLSLDLIGLKLNEKGEIITGLDQSTNLKHVFAAGDIDGGLQFTHTATVKGRVAGFNAARLALGKRTNKKTSDLRIVPWVTFLEQEVASVGMTEEAARVKYKHVSVGRAEFSGLGRSVTDSERHGFVKLVAHPTNGKILGGHIVGDRAGELIHTITLAISLGATVDKLCEMIFAYPTYSEAIKVAACSMKRV